MESPSRRSAPISEAASRLRCRWLVVFNAACSYASCIMPQVARDMAPDTITVVENTRKALSNGASYELCQS